MPEIDPALLRSAFNAIEEGMAVFNSDDQLVACNSRYAAVQEALGGNVRLGGRWQDLVGAGLRQGKIPEARGREHIWLEQRCGLRGSYSALRRTPDGRAYRVSERRLPGGGIVAVWADVTELLGALRPNVILTDRQREILKLLVRGLPMKAVARMLGIAPRTVAFHKYHAMAANGLSTNADLMRFAMEQGLLSMAEGPEPDILH